MTSDKNRQISETMRMTYDKRKHQTCRVFEVKVEKNRLNKTQEESLKMIFVEAKWCFNYLIGKMNNKEIDIFDFDSKTLVDITHKDKDGNDVDVHLNHIKSSQKASIVEGIKSNIKTLRSLKKKGKKVGRIQFKSDYKSIDLKQYGVVYHIISPNRIKVQGIKKALPVNGLRQIYKYGNDYDIANAKLIKKDDDYYINITVFFDNKDCVREYKNEQIGIDFDCETSFTMSDGTKINIFVEETDRLKGLFKKLRRQQNGSNNRYVTIKKIHKEYDKLTRKKNDAANKLVHQLLEENRQIIIQDEQIKSWSSKHGRKVQHSILGRVKTKLKQHKDRVVVLDRFVPTTKFCRDCGTVHTEIQLWDRNFVCPECGVVYDRDIHAAQNMVWIHNNLKNIGLGESEFKRVEFDEEVHRIFGEWDNQMLKHEDATPLV